MHRPQPAHQPSHAPARRSRAGWRCTAALLALASAALPAWSQCKLAGMDIPVRIVDSRPIATMTLEGVEIPMLVDSGAFFSMLPEATAAQLNLRLRQLPGGVRLYGHTGAFAARMTRVKEVKFMGVPVPNVEFIVGGSELGANIMGVLGRNFLAVADTEYDLAHGVVRIVVPKGRDCENNDMAYWAGDAPVISAEMPKFRDTAIRVPVRINGKEFNALLDTGAPYTTLHLKTAKKAGLEEADLTEVGKAGGIGMQRVKSWTGMVDSFEIGGETVTYNKFSVDDTEGGEHDLLVGLDYFLSHRIYVSKLQNKLYATWNGGPVFARGNVAAVYDTRYAALPTQAVDGNADALARRAEAAMTRGDYASALLDLNSACELAPDDAEHVYARARVHLALRQRDQALRDLDEALRLKPTLVGAQVNRAQMRAGRQDREGALADLKQLDASLPPSSKLRADMADAYSLLDMAPEALRQWDLWMPSHRNDSRLMGVLNNRCWLRARLNLELDKALDDCKDAVDLDRTEGRYLDSLAWTYLRRGDLSRAVKNFDRALEHRASPWSLYGRGLAYAKQGKPADAQRDLAAARKLDADIDAEVRQAGFDVAADAPAASTAPASAAGG